MKYHWVVLLGFGFIFIAFVWNLGSNFYPSQRDLLNYFVGKSYLAGVQIPKNVADEIFFPVPAILSAVFYFDFLGMNGLKFANLLIALSLWILIFYRLRLRNTQPESVIIIFFSGLLIPYLINFSIEVIITLFLVLLICCLYPSQKIINIFLTVIFFIILSYTSLFGFLFCVFFTLFQLIYKKFFLSAILLLILAVGVIRIQDNLFSILKQNLIYDTVAEASLAVDQRARLEYKFYNSNDIPITIKRIVYNKYYLFINSLNRLFVSIFDFESIYFPGQDGATVSRWFWTSKGIPLLWFWTIPLSLIAVSHFNSMDGELKKYILILFLSCIAHSIFVRRSDFMEMPVYFSVLLAILAYLQIIHLGRLYKFIFLILALVVTVPGYYFYFGYRNVWIDNRPEVLWKMTEEAKKHIGSNMIITTLTGSSFLYWAFQNEIASKDLWMSIVNDKVRIGDITFDHFSFQSDKRPAPGVYVGLPGEFIGERSTKNRNDFYINELPGHFRLINSLYTYDSLSYGNGDYIWIVQVEK